MSLANRKPSGGFNGHIVSAAIDLPQIFDTLDWLLNVPGWSTFLGPLSRYELDQGLIVVLRHSDSEADCVSLYLALNMVLGAETLDQIEEEVYSSVKPFRDRS